MISILSLGLTWKSITITVDYAYRAFKNIVTFESKAFKLLGGSI
jgi:hypothetical protein